MSGNPLNFDVLTADEQNRLKGYFRRLDLTDTEQFQDPETGEIMHNFKHQMMDWTLREYEDVTDLLNKALGYDV